MKMVNNTRTLSSLIGFIKVFEDRVREIRQKAEVEERALKMEEWGGTSSTLLSQQFLKVNNLALELWDAIRSASTDLD